MLVLIVLDSFAKYRRSIGLPALAINFGHIGSIGVVTRNDAISELLHGFGLQSMNGNILLGSSDLFSQNKEIIDNDYSNIIVSSLNFENLKFSHLFTNKSAFKLNSISNNNNIYGNNNNNNNKFGGDSSIITQIKNWLDKFKNNHFTISEIQKYSINDIIKKLIINK
ncbi:hypothetical protein ACTFIT_003576 [Dictyostelium discoideum]